MLFNLIQNAIRHTPRRRQRDRACRAAIGDAIEIEVADTGDGIAGEHRDARVRAVLPRRRRARTTAGAGLGLAVSRAIVEAHGGSIWLEDATVGTRVRFRLPASSPAPARV